MARHVHGVYAPAGDAEYATPNGEVVQVPQDLAFADTVVALEDEIPSLAGSPISHPPPSMPPSMSGPPSRPPTSRPSHGPAHSYQDYGTQQHDLIALQQQQAHMLAMQQAQSPSQPPHAMHAMHPGMHPGMHGAMPGDPGLVTSVRGAIQRAKVTINSSRGEMKELWTATEQTDPARNRDEKDPLVRLANRIRTFWSFFEWDSDDVARAAWIGLAVFVIAVCGAFALR